MEDFVKFGNKSDKITHHGYQRFYPKLLESFRNEKFGMIEIGISTGNSLPLWKQYFPKAYIYGIDINTEFNEERLTVFKCDQSKLNELENVKSKLSSEYPICFINDDGSHIPEHQLLTFDYFFSEVLQDGGIYIIEDIETSYWKRGGLYGYQTRYGINHPKSIIELFKPLIDYINKEYLSESDKEELNKKINLSTKTKDSISTITFGQNCIIIMKKERDDYKYDRVYRFRSNV